MRHSPLAVGLLGVLVTLPLAPGVAEAATDYFGAGDGSDGDVTISSSGQVVNEYTGLASDASTGDTSLEVDDSSDYAVGDLVVVWQTSGLAAPNASNPQDSIDLSGTDVGHYEFGRVDALPDSQTIELEHALVDDYDASGAQIVSAPEYAELTVESGASITADKAVRGWIR